jgi:hypothetical protein
VSHEPRYLMALSLLSITRAWWGLSLTDTWATRVFCGHGIFSPFDKSGNGSLCRVDESGLWDATLAVAFDALLQSGEKSLETSTQMLWARVETISFKWWWLQGVIPLATFSLYVACLLYTLHINHEGEELKELNLFEVIAATMDTSPSLAAERALTASDIEVGGRGSKRA